MGLGKRIMRGLEEKAIKEKVRIMDLDASLVAYSFYRALGYQTQSEEIIQVKKRAKLKVL